MWTLYMQNTLYNKHTYGKRYKTNWLTWTLSKSNQYSTLRVIQMQIVERKYFWNWDTPNIFLISLQFSWDNPMQTKPSRGYYLLREYVITSFLHRITPLKRIGVYFYAKHLHSRGICEYLMACTCTRKRFRLAGNVGAELQASAAP